MFTEPKIHQTANIRAKLGFYWDLVMVQLNALLISKCKSVRCSDINGLRNIRCGVGVDVPMIGGVYTGIYEKIGLGVTGA